MMMTASRHLRLPILLLGAVTLCQPPAQAQQDMESARARGQVALTYDFKSRVPQREVPAMVATARSVAQVILATPDLANPVGVALNGGIHSSGVGSGMPSTDPHAASGSIILRRINLPLKRKVDAQGRFEGEGEGPTIQVSINNLYFLAGNSPPVANGDYYYLPTNIASERGIMRFEDRGWDIIVIHKPGVLPFAFLTREELLSRAMKSLNPDNPNLDEKRRLRIQEKYDALRSELSKLSPAQRMEPGCENGRIGKQWSRSGCDVPGATYLVRYNPKYFTPGASRTDAQIISLRVRRAWSGGDEMLGGRVRSAFQQIDLRALQAMLKH